MNKHVRTWVLVGLLGAAVGVTVAWLAIGGFRIVAGGGCGIGPCGAGGQRTNAQAVPRGEKPQAFANVTCPIMGSPIDPKNVVPELVRLHKGKKVAFCCGGCPVAWDKLSEAQKDAKLQTAGGGEKAG